MQKKSAIFVEIQGNLDSVTILMVISNKKYILSCIDLSLNICGSHLLSCPEGFPSL